MIKKISSLAIFVLGLHTTSAYSANSLKECLDKCHAQTSLDLKELKKCKAKCQSVEKRRQRRQVRANHMAAKVEPSVEAAAEAQGHQPVTSENLPAAMAAPQPGMDPSQMAQMAAPQPAMDPSQMAQMGAQPGMDPSQMAQMGAQPGMDPSQMAPMPTAADTYAATAQPQG
jgi:hypothetical protein